MEERSHSLTRLLSNYDITFNFVSVDELSDEETEKYLNMRCKIQ